MPRRHARRRAARARKGPAPAPGLALRMRPRPPRESTAPRRTAGGTWRATGRPDAALPDFERTPGEPVSVPHTWGPEARRGAWYHTTLRRAARRTPHVPVVRGRRHARRRLRERHAPRPARRRVHAVHLRRDAPPCADGPNVLAVRVTNHPDDTVDSLPSGPGKQLYRMYGGLYRKVWLIRTAAAHFDLLDHASSGVYVTPTGVTARRRRPRGADARPRARARPRTWSSSRASATRAAARWRSQRVPVRRRAGTPAVTSWRTRVEAPTLWTLGRRTSTACRPSCGPGGRCRTAVDGAHRLPRLPFRGRALPPERAADPAARRRQAPGDRVARGRRHRRRAARRLRAPRRTWA